MALYRAVAFYGQTNENAIEFTQSNIKGRYCERSGGCMDNGSRGFAGLGWSWGPSGTQKRPQI